LPGVQAHANNLHEAFDLTQLLKPASIHGKVAGSPLTWLTSPPVVHRGTKLDSFLKKRPAQEPAARTVLRDLSIWAGRWTRQRDRALPPRRDWHRRLRDGMDGR
jgi:hypothetical protein